MSSVDLDCRCPHDLGDCLALIVGYNDDDYCPCEVCHVDQGEGRKVVSPEYAASRRGVGLFAPEPVAVDCQRERIESYDEPHLVLPEGWQSMTVAELRSWSIEYVASLVDVDRRLPAGWQSMSEAELEAWGDELLDAEGPVPATGREPGEDVTPKGGWDDPWTVYEYSTDGFSVLTVLDDHAPDREPGAWFALGRGGPAMYRNEELAAGRVVYHEDSPVMPEQPVIKIDQYPGPWDWDAVSDDRGLLRAVRPSQHSDARRYERLRAMRPARNFITVEGGE